MRENAGQNNFEYRHFSRSVGRKYFEGSDRVLMKFFTLIYFSKGYTVLKGKWKFRIFTLSQALYLPYLLILK